MTKFTLANLGKEVQRIKFDIEGMDYKSAMGRCEKLDELIYAIEEGEHELVIDNETCKIEYSMKPVKLNIDEHDLKVAICRTREEYLKCNELAKSEQLLISHFEDYLLVYLFDKLKNVCKIGGVIDD